MDNAARVSAQDFCDIQQLVLGFALRDEGRWDELSDLFAKDATISLSWFSGPASNFIETCKNMARPGAPVGKHLLGTPRVTVLGDRAIAHSDAVIMIRIPSPVGELDLTTWARFFDLLVRTHDGWRFARRTAIYERDRLDPVEPGPGGELWDQIPQVPSAFRAAAVAFALGGRPLRLVPDVTVAGSPGEASVIQDGRRWLGE